LALSACLLAGGNNVDSPLIFIVSSIEYEGEAKFTEPDPWTDVADVRHVKTKAAVRAEAVFASTEETSLGRGVSEPPAWWL
jgi:hypothetical protein